MRHNLTSQVSWTGCQIFFHKGFVAQRQVLFFWRTKVMQYRKVKACKNSLWVFAPNYPVKLDFSSRGHSNLIKIYFYFSSRFGLNKHEWCVIFYVYDACFIRTKQGAAVCSVAIRMVTWIPVSCWSPWKRRMSGIALTLYATWKCFHMKRLRRLKS